MEEQMSVPSSRLFVRIRALGQKTTNTKFGFPNVAKVLSSLMKQDPSFPVRRSSSDRKLQRRGCKNATGQPSIAPAQSEQLPPELVVGSNPARELHDKLNVPIELLQCVAQVLDNCKDYNEARELESRASHQLATLGRRLHYLKMGSGVITDWRQNLYYVLKDADDLNEREVTELVELPGRIDEYKRQLVDLEEAIRSVHSQQVVMKIRFENLMAANQALHGSTYTRVLELLGNDKRVMTYDTEEFAVTCLIDDERLQIIEEDCDHYLRSYLKQEPRESGKYPCKPTPDWHWYVTEYELKQDLYMKVRDRLRSRLPPNRDGDNVTSISLEKSRESLQAAEDELRVAVAGLRWAGMSSRSVSSLLDDRRRSVTIASAYAMQEQDADEDDLSPEELEDHLERGHEATDKWLRQNSLNVSPEEVGPATPSTPLSPWFSKGFDDVEVGDSVSNIESPVESLVSRLTASDYGCSKGSNLNWYDRVFGATTKIESLASKSSTSQRLPVRRAASW